MITNSISKEEFDAATLELPFMRRIINEALGQGWQVYHSEDSRRDRRGFPDIVLAHPTRGFLMPEMKTHAGKLSTEQQQWIAVLTHLGIYAPVWRPADWPLIERLLKGQITIQQCKEALAHESSTAEDRTPPPAPRAKTARRSDQDTTQSRARVRVGR